MTTAVPLSRLVLRGDHARHTNHMEDFQEAYVEAVAAAAGCNMQFSRYDDGVDLTLTHHHAAHTINQEQKVRLDIQLKATSILGTKTHAKAKISRRRFREFSLSSPSIARIVVIMEQPSDQCDWIITDTDHLRIFHRCYWVNLAGLPEPPGSTQNVPIKANRAQVFDDIALAQMMEKIGKGGMP